MFKQKQIPKYVKLVLSLAVPLIASGIVSSYGMDSNTPWYLALNKPAFQPPSWIFGPVWSVLYTLMGVALYLVWSSKPNKLKPLAITVFLLQLSLNLIWPLLFFGWQAPEAALVEMSFLWMAILTTIFIFLRISRPAAYAMMPYLAWVSFAFILNSSLVYLN